MRSSSSARGSVGGQPATTSPSSPSPPPLSAESPSLSASPISVRSQYSRCSAPPSPAAACLAHEVRLPPPPSLPAACLLEPVVPTR